MIAETFPPPSDEQTGVREARNRRNESSESRQEPHQELIEFLRRDAENQAMNYLLRSNTNHDGE